MGYILVRESVCFCACVMVVRGLDFECNFMVFAFLLY